MELHDAEQHEAFERGTMVAQIFSGAFFSLLAAWLMVSNGVSLDVVQNASLQKRLTFCCFLNTYVGLFSAFFNFFQLTAIDDAILPSTNNFTLDLARPVEWILTCPLMQLSLVLMGGNKIPEYRRYLMPMFSVTILALGTAASLQASILLKSALYICGVMVFCAMFSFNRWQIIEYSDGEEGIFFGTSEFRRATLLLLCTWSPFPMWYLVSPEGLGFIDNVLVIQIGWAVLNIVSKFIFIFYMQRVKDLYCNPAKAKMRELRGITTQSSTWGILDDEFNAVVEEKKQEGLKLRVPDSSSGGGARSMSGGEMVGIAVCSLTFLLVCVLTSSTGSEDGSSNASAKPLDWQCNCAPGTR